MPVARIVVVGAAVLAVLWVAFDASVTGSPPVPGTTPALAVLSALFGFGAWMMQVGGRPERAPLLAGLCLGTGAYVVLQFVLPG